MSREARPRGSDKAAHPRGSDKAAHPRPAARGHRPHAGAPSQRQLRVAEEVRHVLAEIFTRAEFRDPELAVAHVTVVEVRLGPDLKHATAFVSVLGHGDVAALLPALRRAVPYLRGQMARSLRLRAVPDLSFQPDVAIEYATHVDALLRSPEVSRDLGAHAPED